MSVEVPSVAEFEALKAAVTSNSVRLTNHAARLNALENSPQPDPDPIPDPDPAPGVGVDLADWRLEELPDPPAQRAKCVRIVDDPLVKGKKAIQFLWEKGDAYIVNGEGKNKLRAEIKRWKGKQLFRGKEYVIKFGTLLEDNENNRELYQHQRINCHCIQFHNIGDRGTSGINQRAGQYHFSFGAVRERPVGAILLGKRANWEIRANVSEGDDGYLKVFLNGELVIDHKGKTASADLNPKAGHYWEPNIWQYVPGVTYLKFFLTDYEIIELN